MKLARLGSRPMVCGVLRRSGMETFTLRIGPARLGDTSGEKILKIVFVPSCLTLTHYLDSDRLEGFWRSLEVYQH